MTTVLLTGAAGMIGQTVLAELLTTGSTVWTTDIRPISHDRHLVVDLLDPAAVVSFGTISPDVTIHLSGAVSGSHHDLFNANALATVRLLDRLPEGSRVVVAGSAAEYGPVNGRAVQESDPLQPSGRYGWAKLAQTTLAGTIAARRGLHLSIVRPFNVIGPNLPPTTALGNMASQLRSAIGEIEIKVGRLDVVRDYVSLPFVAKVFAAVAGDTAAPAVVNACSGVGLELGSILDAMIDLSGADATVVSDPDLVALPAPPAVVGDPAMVIDRYGLRLRFDAESVARMVLALPSGS